MENTTTNKEKFFAAHWGQRIWIRTHGNGEQVRLYINADTMEAKKGNINHDYLELTSLHEVTEEHAVELAKIVMTNPRDYEQPIDAWIGEGDNDPNGDHWLEVGAGCYEGILIINPETGTIKLINEDSREIEEELNSVAVVDFLRSKGYLLPYNGLTPEQILSYGWARLTLTENGIKNAGL